MDSSMGPRYSDVREKLLDPKTQSWFLHFDPSKNGTYRVPQCDTNFKPPRCSNLYHDQVRSFHSKLFIAPARWS